MHSGQPVGQFPLIPAVRPPLTALVSLAAHTTAYSLSCNFCIPPRPGTIRISTTQHDHNEVSDHQRCSLAALHIPSPPHGNYQTVSVGRYTWRGQSPSDTTTSDNKVIWEEATSPIYITLRHHIHPNAPSRGGSEASSSFLWHTIPNGRLASRLSLPFFQNTKITLTSQHLLFHLLIHRVQKKRYTWLSS